MVSETEHNSGVVGFAFAAIPTFLLLIWVPPYLCSNLFLYHNNVTRLPITADRRRKQKWHYPSTNHHHKRSNHIIVTSSSLRKKNSYSINRLIVRCINIGYKPERKKCFHGVQKWMWNPTLSHRSRASKAWLPSFLSYSPLRLPTIYIFVWNRQNGGRRKTNQTSFHSIP